MPESHAHITQPAATSRPPTPPLLPRRIAVRVLLTQSMLAAVVGLTFLMCYAGLQKDPQPHQLPVAVSDEQTAMVAQQLLGDRVAVRAVASAAAAEAAVLDREQVAGMALNRNRQLTLYVAGPNGLAENGAAEQMARAISQQERLGLQVVDVRPLLPFDPRGLASFYIALGGTVASFILAQAMFAVRMLIRVRTQLVTLSAFAIVTGLALALLSGPLLHVTPIPWLLLAPVLALLSVAVSFGTRALIAWFGSIGITVATLMMTAVGLSTSGGIIGVDLLPAPLARIGAVLPPGAAIRAIVAIAYFDGQKSAAPLLVLAIWAALGLGFVALRDSKDAQNSRPMKATAAGAPATA